MLCFIYLGQWELQIQGLAENVKRRVLITLLVFIMISFINSTKHAVHCLRRNSVYFLLTVFSIPLLAYL